MLVTTAVFTYFGLEGNTLNPQQAFTILSTFMLLQVNIINISFKNSEQHIRLN